MAGWTVKLPTSFCVTCAFLRQQSPAQGSFLLPAAKHITALKANPTMYRGGRKEKNKRSTTEDKRIKRKEDDSHQEKNISEMREKRA